MLIATVLLEPSVLEAQPGTERVGTEMGKASSYYVFAPPLRENLHMDEARRRRAPVHCDRYDFSFQGLPSSLLSSLYL